MSTETSAIPTTPAAPAVAATPPATPPAAAPQPQTVTIPLEQLQTFTSVQARLAQLEAEQRSATRQPVPSKSSCWLPKARSRMPFDSSAKRRRSSSTPNDHPAPPSRNAQSGMRSMVRFRASSRRQPLVPGGAEQLTQLWRNQFIVEPARRLVSRSVRRRFNRSATSCRPSSPDRSTRISSALEPWRRHCRLNGRPHDRADVAGKRRGPDAAQELRRGDHPADAGDSKRSASRSAVESGRPMGLNSRSMVIVKLIVFGRLSLVLCLPNTLRG